ncbi:MAG: hypothetical protein EOP48_04720 [Sphingobacteriales bacterium]|nr:MAG: hypothetical protein EOP48_04720 [Sphingobacteriales bacterium]
MKRLIVFGFLALTIYSCKKDYDKVSQVVDVSAPTISFTGSKFYSIKVNDPAPAIEATAYDSILNEAYPVDYDPTVIDVTTPGLYVVPMTSKNKNGYVGSDVVYVAVTDIPESIDLSGTYIRVGNDEPMHVTKIANGLYETDDVGGAPTLEITGYFAQLNLTDLDFPEQPTEAGNLSAVNATVTAVDGADTTISWAVRNGFFGTAQRTFVKE